jgi:transglutaminase-like putative cysteine protease
MTTLDRFSDAGWQSSKLTGNASSNSVKNELPRPSGLTTAPSEPVTTKIHITNLNAQWLPAPAVPNRVEVDGPWLYDPTSETVFSIRTGTKQLKKIYRVTSLHVAPERTALANANATQVPNDVLPYQLDPGSEVTPKVRLLTEQLTASQPTPYAKVAALQAFFTDPKENFRYSTSTLVDGINSKSALEDFLNFRQGFCEQYASAMAAMIRVAGVPARVAVGFTPGTLQKNGSYRVTTKDAHAWPEAWFQGAGWVRFEPTPRSDQISVPAYARANADGSTDPGTGGPSPAPSASASSRPGAAGLSPLNGRPEDDLTGALGATTKPSRSRFAALWLPGLIALVVLLFVPRVLHLVRRRRRWRSAGPLVAWQQVCDDALDLGHRWRPVDSPRAGAAHLAQRYAFDAAARDGLERLAAGAERARYARDGATAGAAAAVRADAALVRSALRAAVPRKLRWRAWLLPTSTLRWASSGLGTLVADGLDRFDETWSALGRRLRPRPFRQV